MNCTKKTEKCWSVSLLLLLLLGFSDLELIQCGVEDGVIWVPTPGEENFHLRRVLLVVGQFPLNKTS